VDDEPRIFEDPLAGRSLGDRADELLGYHTPHGQREDLTKLERGPKLLDGLARVSR
jgi:hypothetical protein